MVVGVALTVDIFSTGSIGLGETLGLGLNVVLFESSDTIPLFPSITTFTGALFFNSFNAFLSKDDGIGKTWVCVDCGRDERV